MRSLTPPMNVAECDSLHDSSLVNSSPIPSCVEAENMMRETDYTDMKPVQSCYMIPEDETESWRKRHPSSWEPTEVVAWITHQAVALSGEIDLDKLCIEKFQDCTGKRLELMTKPEFEALEPQYGGLLYLQFQELLTESQFNPAGLDLGCHYSDPIMGPPDFSHLGMLINDDLPDISADDLFLSDTNMQDSDFGLDFLPMQRTFSDSVLSETSGYGTDSTDGLAGDILSDSMNSSSPLESTITSLSPLSPDPTFTVMMASSLSSSSCRTTTQLPPMTSFLHCPQEPINNGYTDLNIPAVVTNHLHSVYDESPAAAKPQAKGPNKRGRPRKNPESFNGSAVKSHRGRKQASKGSHLWEFVRDLLKSDEHNPSIVRWESHAEGIFRFVKSETVAKMWGKRKNNNTMTYEKLSRAMRHYYKNEILLPVLGRRLVYQFGPCSYGWASWANASPAGREELQQHHHHHHHQKQQQQHHYNQQPQQGIKPSPTIRHQGATAAAATLDDDDQSPKDQLLYHRQHELLVRASQDAAIPQHPMYHHYQKQHHQQQHHQQQHVELLHYNFQQQHQMQYSAQMQQVQQQTQQQPHQLPPPQHHHHQQQHLQSHQSSACNNNTANTYSTPPVEGSSNFDFFDDFANTAELMSHYL